MTTTNAAPTADEVADIVKDVLQRDEIDADKDLFAQGASSLAYVRVVAEINNRWGLSLNGSEVDGVATVSRLATVAADAAEA